MDKLDPKTTALVVIDLQKPIVAMALAPHSGPDVVKRSSDIARALRAGGGVVVQVRVKFHDLLDALQKPADEPSMARTMSARTSASERVRFVSSPTTENLKRS